MFCFISAKVTLSKNTTGVVMASKLLQTPLKERVPGIELMEVCLNIANEQHQKVFLLGAENEVPHFLHLIKILSDVAHLLYSDKLPLIQYPGLFLLTVFVII